MGETRKLAAILVADMAGYSRLVGADDAQRRRLTSRALFSPSLSVIWARRRKRSGSDANWWRSTRNILLPNTLGRLPFSNQAAVDRLREGLGKAGIQAWPPHFEAPPFFEWRRTSPWKDRIGRPSR